MQIAMKLRIDSLCCCFEVLQVALTEKRHQIPSNAIPPWLENGRQGWQA